MDRRQRKTRRAIFDAFESLMAEEHYSQVTVAQIIERADIGRSTFYGHFETKDELTDSICREMFDHVFEGVNDDCVTHAHLETPDLRGMLAHLLYHLRDPHSGVCGQLVMEGGIFTNYGTLIVDEAAGIDYWNPNSTVQNYGTIQLYGDLRFGDVCAVDNSGSFIVMNQKHLPTEIRFNNNPYHYPEEHRLVLPASVTMVEEEAFANTGAWEIVLPADIDSIGENAFAGSENLFLVVIPNGNASITGNPFENSDKVTIAAPAPGAVETFATNAGIPFLPLQ